MKLTQLLTLALICLGLPVTAAEKSPGPARKENRFLFVVDISFSMSRLSHSSREVLQELIYSGLHHQMEPGDTFSIWTFNSEPHMDKYPLQVWDPKKNLELANASAKFLRLQYYEGRDRIDVLLRDLFLVIGDVQDLNIIILSDGETPMSGTPFDSAITAVYKSNAAKVHSARKPFVTALVARGGRLANWSVTIGEQPFRLPEGPEEELATPVISAVPTNAAPAVSGMPMAKTKAADLAVTAPAASKSATLPSPAQTPAQAAPALRISEPPKSVAAKAPGAATEAPTAVAPTASSEVKMPTPTPKASAAALGKIVAQAAVPPPAPIQVTSTSRARPTQTNSSEASASQVEKILKAVPIQVESPAVSKTPSPALPPPAVAVTAAAPTTPATNAAKVLLRPSLASPSLQSAPGPEPAQHSLPTTAAREPLRPAPVPPEPLHSAAPPLGGSASATAPSHAPEAKTISPPTPMVTLLSPPPAPVQPDRLTVSAREPARPNSKPSETNPRRAMAPPAAALPAPSENPHTLLLMGTALLVIATMLGLWAFFRFRAPPSPSLISRSIDGR